MADTPTYVFSHDPAAAKPVATQIREFGSVGSTAAFQLMLVTDGRSNTLASVRSLSGSNPVAVALTDATGGHVTTLPVTGSLVTSVAGQVTVTGSVTASQGGAPWSWVGSATVTGSVGALVTGTVVSSVIGQPTVTASVAGNVPVTQATSPWGVAVGSVAFTVPQGAVVGSVVAAQGGAPWTVTGSVQVTQQTSPWVTQAGSTGAFVGFVVASIVGGGSAVTGSVWVSNTPTVNVLQVSSPWIVQPASVAYTVPQGAVVASLTGQPTVTASIAGTVGVTQSTSPWAVAIGSGGQFVGYVVASVVGGGTSTSSVFATQVGSWAAFLSGGANGLPAGVSSYGGDGHLLRVDLVRGSLSAGADGSIVDGSDTTIKATVRSYASGIKPLATQLVSSGGVLADITSRSGGNALKVDLVQGTITGANGSILDGADSNLAATVRSYAGGKPLAVALTDLVGSHYVTVPVTGFLVASVAGQVTVTASITGTPTVNQGGAPWTVTGSVWVTNTPTVNVLQVTSPWGVAVGSTGTFQGFVVASVVGQMTATASISGNVPVTQTTSPWVVLPGSTGAFQGFGVSSVVGQVTVTASVAGAIPVTQSTSPWITQGGSSGAFLGFVVASVVGGGSSITGSVWVVNTVSVAQGTVPWVTTGSVQVTQASSPWVTQAGSTGAFVGFVVASIVGGGSSVTGSVWVVNTVSVTQGTVPWVIVGSVTTIGSVGATITGSIAGTVVASVIGQPTVTASVVGFPTVIASVAGQLTTTASIAGNVPVTQVTSPWVTFAGSTGTFQGFGVSSVVGQVTVTASVVGNPTVIASVVGQLTTTASISGNVPVTQVTSPWAVFVGSTGAFQGFGVSSVVGQVTVTASVVGFPTVIASVAGQLTTTASIAGNVPVTQVTSPWVTQAGSTGVFAGFVVASVAGTVSVQASVTGQLTTTASIAGNVPVTQVTSPWVTFAGSTGAFVGFGVSSVVGQVTVTASVVGFPTVIASVAGQLTTTASISGNVPVTQVTSPWAVFVGSTGAFQGFTVTSVVGALTVTGSVFSTPAGGTFSLAKVAWEVSSYLPFPFDGSGVCRSVSATTTTLATDVLSSDLSGLRLLIVSSGAAMGQSVAITGWDSQANQRVAHAAWGVTPSSGNQYVLLLDANGKTNVQVRCEVSSLTAKVHYAMGLWAAVQSGNLGTSTTFPQNVPRPAMDVIQVVDAIPTSYGIAVPSYWPAEAKQVNAAGYVGVKVYVTSATARFSLWGGAI